jgi:ribosomal protein L16/L10AE
MNPNNRFKSHKGRTCNIFSTKGLGLEWGNSGLFSLQGGIIKEAEMNALELALKRQLKKNGRIYKRLNSG